MPALVAKTILGHLRLFLQRLLLLLHYRYRIAGNFQGSKLSRIRPKIIFTELIFTNFIIQPFCTVLFIILQILFLRISINREKSESFQLYGITLQYIINITYYNYYSNHTSCSYAFMFMQVHALILKCSWKIIKNLWCTTALPTAVGL